MSVTRLAEIKRSHLKIRSKEHQMAQEHHTQQLVRAEEKNMVLFCLVKDVYQSINPWARRYESLKLLSDSEALALVLFQQRRSVEPERSFLRDGAYFFSHLFPGVVGLAPSSFHRPLRNLRRFLELLRRAVVAEFVGHPKNAKRHAAVETIEQAAGLFEDENLRAAFDESATSKLH
jgi:hypothetical protein